MELTIYILLILLGLCILSYMVVSFIEVKGKINRKKWLEEYHSLKRNDFIIISHPGYDNEAIFLEKDEQLNLIVRPFIDGVLKTTAVIKDSQFLHKKQIK